MSIEIYKLAIKNAEQESSFRIVAKLSEELGDEYNDKLQNLPEAIKWWEYSKFYCNKVDQRGEDNSNVLCKLFLKIATAKSKIENQTVMDSADLITTAEEVRANKETGGLSSSNSILGRRKERESISTTSELSLTEVNKESVEPQTQVGTAAKKAKPRGRSGDEMRPWTYEEDMMLIKLVEEEGKRWRTIESLFPDRNAAMCRNRYGRMEAPDRPELNSYKPSVNRCKLCGEIKKGHTCKAKKSELVIMSGQGNLPAPGSIQLSDAVGNRLSSETELVCDSLVTLSSMQSRTLLSHNP